jgi:REP element-mobilizing transposase RayT
MKNYRKIYHFVGDLKYQLVGITKYRKPVFWGDAAHQHGSTPIKLLLNFTVTQREGEFPADLTGKESLA